MNEGAGSEGYLLTGFFDFGRGIIGWPPKRSSVRYSAKIDVAVNFPVEQRGFGRVFETITFGQCNWLGST